MEKYKSDISFFATTVVLFLLMFTIVRVPYILASEEELFIGTSFGTLTVDGVRISLNHSYAMKQHNLLNASKKDVVILLTEKPLPESLVKDIEDITLAALNHHNLVCFRIDETGELYNAIFDHPSIKGDRLSMSGSRVIEYFPGVFEKDRIEGLFKSKKEQDIRGQAYQINAKFSAQITPSSELQPSETRIAGIIDDLGMNKIEASKRPKSDWIEAEKALYRDVLKNRTFDILIIPFQVQAYAIDRPGRSLMTRYLASRIKDATDEKIPDPTLVARALGQDARSFDDQEIYDLADLIKAKIIIKGYVGHNRDEKMKLTVIIQSRTEHGSFEPGINTTQSEWQDTQFSDEHPPSEVFLGMLDEIISKLPLKSKRQHEVIVYKETPELLIPEKIQSIFQNKADPPIVSAYFLQLLGMLFPEQTTANEYLFERSLLALTRVSPQSSGYNLLKARAYFYLHRRPAALKTLGASSMPADKAFLAYLNGNLLDIQKSVNEIQSPVQKLMAQIELNDLSLSYGRDFDEKKIEDIVRTLPADWKMVVARRFHEMDTWYVQSNLDVKLKMDEDFPVPGVTAKDLFMKSFAIKESPLESADIDLSVYRHHRKVLTNRGREFAQVNNWWYPVEMDYLDLLCAIGESNVIKKIYLLGVIKHFPESAREVLDRYAPVYRGHPAITYLNSLILYNISDSKKDEEREYLKKKAREDAYNAYYWSQGQTLTAMKSGGLYMAGASSPFPPTFYMYEGDYPKRFYWNTFRGGERQFLKGSLLSGIQIPDALRGDLLNAELSLRYSQNSFSTVESFYRELINLKNHPSMSSMTPELETLINDFVIAQQHRFVGNPKRDSFLAGFRDLQKESRNFEKFYKDAIAANPEGWGLYMKLASFYMQHGEFKKALSTFLEYPLFKNQQNDERVKMSNLAHSAALELWWVGAISESLPLFTISANSKTGSAAEMASSAIIALLQARYAEAASHNLELFKRYNNRFGFRDYLSLLHVMGRHDEAWSLINTADIQLFSPQIWTSVFLGLRIQGADDERIGGFFSQHNIIEAGALYGDKAIMMLYLIDRAPTVNAAKLLRDVKWRVEEKWREKVQDAVKAKLVDFVDAYYALKKGKLSEAYEIYKKQRYFHNDYELHECALPYIYWAAAKNGKLQELETELTKLKDLQTVQSEEYEFYAHLSHAVELGLQGQNKKAEEHLKNASYRIPATGSKPFFGWYQLVEICEWLHKETNDPTYKGMALKWTKLHQRIQSMFAWAYAVEAKYAENPSERLRALALTLYLDRDSERINNFSESEKAKASEWLKENNPFLKDLDSVKNAEKETF